MLLHVWNPTQSLLYASKSDDGEIIVRRVSFPRDPSELAPYAILFGLFPQPNWTEHWIPKPRPLWPDWSAPNDLSREQLMFASRALMSASLRLKCHVRMHVEAQG